MNRFVGFMSYGFGCCLTENGLMKPMILRLAFFPVVFLVSSFGATAESTDDAALKDRLIALEKKSWEAWKNRDSKFFQEFLSDDHVEVGFGGVSNKAELVPFARTPACPVQSSPLPLFRMYHRASHHL